MIRRVGDAVEGVLGGTVEDVVGPRLLRRLGRASARVQEERDLPVDLYESDDEYLATFATPGAAPGDVQVRYVDDRIAVRVERFRAFHEGYEMRYPGRGLSLDGSVELPGDADVDAEQADATLTQVGTLTVRIPKRRSSDPEEAVSGS